MKEQDQQTNELKSVKKDFKEYMEKRKFYYLKNYPHLTDGELMRAIREDYEKSVE